MKRCIYIVSFLLAVLTAQAATTTFDATTYSTNVAWTVASGNNIIVTNGGVLKTGVGLAKTANNLVLSGNALVTGANSILTNTGGILLSGANLALTVDNGGQLDSSKLTVGNGAAAPNDRVLVTGLNSKMNIGYDVAAGANQLIVGNTASTNQNLTLSNGGTLNVASQHTTVIGILGQGNSIVVDGAGSTFSGGNLRVGESATALNNSFTVSAGGKANFSGQIIIGGSTAGTLNNSVLVTGAGSTLSSTNGQWTYIGNAAANSSMTIANGGAVFNTSVSTIGQLAGATNCSVLVTGAGSLWSNNALRVGQAGTSGSLTISDSGKVIASNITGSAALSKINVNGGTLAVNNFNGIGANNTLSLSNGTLRAYLGDSTWVNKMTLAGGTSMFDTSDELGGAARAISVTNVISGSGALKKVGVGTLTFSGANQIYTGTTTVDAGKLIVNSRLSGDVNVSSGAILGGSGTVQRVTLNAGSLLSVGNSPGTMTFAGDLTLADGATNYMEIFTVGSDVLKGSSTNTLTLFGATIIDFTGNSVTNGSVFAVFQNWSSITTNGANFTAVGLGGGQSLDLNQITTSGLLTVIPEPATIGMLGLGALLTLVIRRRFFSMYR